MLRAADVLDHADARRSRRTARRAARGSRRRGCRPGRRARPPRRAARASSRLRLGQRDAGDVHAVLARGVQGERAPAAADVEHALARLRARACVQTSSSLVALGLLERRRAAREDRARVGHRLVEEAARRTRWRRRSGGGPRARRARRLWRRPRGPQLGGRRRAAAACSPPRPQRRGGEVAPGRAVDRRRLQLSSSVERRVHVVDLDLAARRRRGRGRAGPARAARGRARRGERTPERRAAAAVGRRQRACRPTARRGTGAREAPPRAPGAAARCAHRAHGAGASCLRAWRSGLTRTTSQASPVLSSARMTAADGSTCQRLRPWLGRGGERVVVVVPRLAERRAAPARRGCATRRRCRSAGARRSGTAS